MDAPVPLKVSVKGYVPGVTTAGTVHVIPAPELFSGAMQAVVQAAIRALSLIKDPSWLPPVSSKNGPELEPS